MEIKMVVNDPAVAASMRGKIKHDVFVPVVSGGKISRDLPAGCFPAFFVNGAEWEEAAELMEKILSEEKPKLALVRLFNSQYLYLLLGRIREMKYPGTIFVVSDKTFDVGKRIVPVTYDGNSEWVAVTKKSSMPRDKNVVWLFPTAKEIESFFQPKTNRAGTVTLGGLTVREAPSDSAPFYPDPRSPIVLAEGEAVEVTEIVEGEYFDWGHLKDGGWVAIRINKVVTVQFNE